MRIVRTSYLTLALLFASIVLFNVFLVSRSFPSPLPAAGISPKAEYVILDYAGVLGGVRRLLSDIAWIQLLQYYGTPETKMDKEKAYELSIATTKFLLGFPQAGHDSHGEHEHFDYQPDYEGGLYPELLVYSERITKLDPFFSYTYLYGAGALAWNLNRPDEALVLLRTGIENMEKYRTDITKDVRQPYWQYHLYASAIIYRKMGKLAQMTTLLETAVRQPDCPNMVKTVLANIYQKENKLYPALKLWVEVYDSDDPLYRTRSSAKIKELRSLIGR